MTSAQESLPASSSRLGLLRCPNATSLGWVSRPNGDLDVAAAIEPGPVDCESLHEDSGAETTVSVFPMVCDGDEVALSMNTRLETSSNPAHGSGRDTMSSTPLADNNVNIDKSQVEVGRDASKLDAEFVNFVTGESSTKRPRILDFGASHHSSDVDNNARDFSPGCVDVAADDSPESSSASMLESPHLSVTLDYEQRTNSNIVGGSQILTVKYHTHVAVLLETESTQSTTVIGTISGRAKIELLPPFSETADNVQIDSSSIDEGQQNSMLSLEIFGYRMSHQPLLSCNHPIIINRPNWMNSLPISVVYHSSNINQAKKTNPHLVLRVRIQSITNDESENVLAASDAENCCYTAYPEESYEIRILPSNCIYPENYTAAGSGVCTVLDTWKHTLDKIINGIVDDDSNSFTNGETTTDSVDNDDKRLKNDDRILICGAKGVGKSNLLRYSTNRLLTASQPSSSPTKQLIRRVAILDVDCGQAELSPPGVLSLTIVTRPLLSEPPVHMICGGGSCDRDQRKLIEDQHDNLDEEYYARHEASYFFGDVTSKADPDTYIRMVSQLMKRYLGVAQMWGGNLPLLINTDGWVKGLGYEILCGIIGIINPGHVVQIIGSTKAKSFDMSAHHQYSPVASNYDQCRHKSRSVHILQSFDESIFSTLSGDDRCRLRSGDSRSSTKTMHATASDHRVHRLCTYFLGGYNQMINLRSSINGEDGKISFHKEKGLHDPNNIIGLTLSSMLPYAVPFHYVRIYPPSGLLDGITELRPLWGVQGDMTCNDVLDSLNGSIVGLCGISDAIDVPLTSCNGGTGVPILNCVGLGIVRSIDYRRKLFFVLTPVHPHLLTSVKSLVGGQIHLPLECVYRGVHSDSFPFMSCCHNITRQISG